MLSEGAAECSRDSSPALECESARESGARGGDDDASFFGGRYGSGVIAGSGGGAGGGGGGGGGAGGGGGGEGGGGGAIAVAGGRAAAPDQVGLSEIDPFNPPLSATERAAARLLRRMSGSDPFEFETLDDAPPLQPAHAALVESAGALGSGATAPSDNVGFGLGHGGGMHASRIGGGGSGGDGGEGRDGAVDSTHSHMRVNSMLALSTIELAIDPFNPPPLAEPLDQQRAGHAYADDGDAHASDENLDPFKPPTVEPSGSGSLARTWLQPPVAAPADSLVDPFNPLPQLAALTADQPSLSPFAPVETGGARQDTASPIDARVSDGGSSASAGANSSDVGEHSSDGEVVDATAEAYLKGSTVLTLSLIHI